MSQSLNALAPDNKYERMGKSDLSPEDYKRWCRKMKEMEKCKSKEMEYEPLEEVREEIREEESSFGLGWLGILILWFIIFTVLFWLIFYSLKPNWAINPDGTINTGKILLAAIVASIILVIIIWLIYSCICYSR